MSESEKKPKRFDLVGEYDLEIGELEDGSYVQYSDFNKQAAELQWQSDQMGKLSQDNQNLIAELQAVKAERDDACQLANNYGVQIEQLKSEITRLTSGDKVPWRHAQDLRDELQGAKEEIERLKADLAEARNMLRIEINGHAASQAEIERLKEKNKKLEAELQAAKLEINRLRIEPEKLRLEIRDMDKYRVERDKLKSENEKLKQSNLNLLRENGRLEEKEYNTSEECDRLKSEIERLKAENKFLEERLRIIYTRESTNAFPDSGIKMEMLKSEIESLRSQLAAADAYGKATGQQYVSVRTELAASESKREKLNGFWTEMRKAWIAGSISDDAIKRIVNSYDKALAEDEGK